MKRNYKGLHCYITLKDGSEQKSELFESMKDFFQVPGINKKETIYNNARKAFDYVFSEQFKQWFGDWEQSPETIDPRLLNEQGQPRLLPMAENYKSGFRYFQNAQGQRMTLTSYKFAGLPADFVEEFVKDVMATIIEENSFRDFENLSSNQLDIDKVIADKIDELLDNVDTENMAAIQNIVVLPFYAGEFKEALKNEFRVAGIKLKDVSDDKLEDEDLANNNLNITESSRVNSKENATANIKLMLNFILPRKYKNDEGEWVFVTGKYFGGRVYRDFGEVWQLLEPKLADTVDTFINGEYKSRFENMITKLEELAAYDSSIGLLLDLLKDKEQFPVWKQKQFVQAFTKDKVNYLNHHVETSRSQNRLVTTKHTIFNADTHSPEKVVAAEWDANFATGPLVRHHKDKEKNLEFYSDRFEPVMKKFQQVTAIAKELDRGEKQPNQKQINLLLSVLGDIGINMTAPEIRFILNNMGYSELVGKVANLYTRIAKTAFFKNKEGNYESPLAQESIVLELAKSKVVVAPQYGENTILGKEGRYWVYSLPSFISSTLNKIKAGDLSALEELRNLPGYKRSLLVQKLLNEPEFRKELTLERFSTLKQTDVSGDKGEDNKSISLFDDLVSSMNRMLQGSLKGGSSHANMLTPADKQRMELLKGMPYYFTGYDGKTMDRTSLKVLIGYVLDELELIRDLQLNGTDNDYAKKNLAKNPMYVIPSIWELPATHPLAALFETVDGKKVPIEKIGPTLKDKLGEYIVEQFGQKVEEAKQTLKKKGIGLPHIDNQVLLNYKPRHDDMFHGVVSDWVFNSMVTNIEMTKLFTGSPIYYKNIDDFFKRVPATYTDGQQLILDSVEDLEFGVAIVNSIIAPSQYMLNDSHIKRVSEAVKLPEEQVRKLLDAYKENNIADAQAWITVDRWEFLLRKLGKWTPKHGKIIDKIKMNESLTPDEFKIAAQPVKGVHFQLVNGVPHYLKYSQAVIIPGLYGTELGKLADLMDEAGVDEVITKDGIKAGFGVPDDIADGVKLKKGAKLTRIPLDNRYWKLQQDLPTKTIKKGVLASQIQKNILANINKDTLYNNGMSGEQLYSSIWNTMNELLDMQMKDMMEELGLTEDDEGNLVILDGFKDRFRERIVKELEDNNEAQSIIDAVSSGIDFDLVPSVRERVENVLASYMKKRLINIEVNQAALIQISNFGTYNLSDEDKNGIIMLRDEKELQAPYVDADGNVTPGDCFIPSWILEEKIPNYKDMSREELLAAIDDELLEFIGYRIPNQGMSSIDKLRVAGILPASAGDSIIVYTGLTTKTGSDFDIDKMYAIFPNAKWQDGRLNYVSSDGNTKEALQNRLVEYYKVVLSDPATYLDLITPLDFVTSLIKNDIEDIHNIKGRDYGDLGTFSPLTQMDIKHKLKEGKGGVGSNANHMIHHVLGQIAEMEAWSLLTTKGNYKEITTIDKRTGEPKKIKITDFAGINVKGERFLKITHMLSATLNGFVDIAKDPWISEGNYTSATKAVVMLMYRAGIPYQFINRVIGQPILKRYSELFDESLARFSDVSYNDILPQLEVEFPMENADELKEYNIDGFDYQDFEVAISNWERYKDVPPMELDHDFVILQRKVLQLFMKAKGLSEELTKHIQATKFDVNGAGNTGAKQIATRNKVLELFHLSKFPDGVAFNLFDESTVLGKRFRNGVEALMEINALYNFETTPQVAKLINQVALELTGEILTDEELADTIANAIYPLMFSSAPAITTEDLGSLFIGKNSVAMRLNDLKSKTEYAKNPLVKNLVNRRNSGVWSFIDIDTIRNVSSKERNDIINGWRELLLSSDPKVKAFAEDLVKVAYYQSGFSMGMGTFYDLIPPDFYTAYNVDFAVDAWKKALVEGYDLNSVVEMIVRNHYDNNTLVPAMGQGKLKRYGVRTAILKEKEIVLEVPKDEKTPNYFKTKATIDNVKTWAVFKKVGTKAGQTASTHAVLYRRVNLAGLKDSTSGGRIFEFTESRVSQITANNLITPEEIKEIEKNAAASGYLLLNTYGASKKLMEKILNNLKLDDFFYPTAAPTVPAPQLALPLETETINIYAGANQNAHLSNFANRPFIPLSMQAAYGFLQEEAYGHRDFTLTFNTVEGAYQAAKIHYASADELTGNIVIAKKLQTATGAEAKRLGQQIKGLDVEKWDNLSSKIMARLVRDSFVQNPAAAQALLATGDATLTHTQDKSKWRTEFPRILMELRRELRNNNPSQLYSRELPTESTTTELSHESMAKLNAFLEAIGVNIELVPQILDGNGNIVDNALAAADFIEGNIKILDQLESRPAAWNELPEEAAHFFYEMLTDSALKRQIKNYVLERAGSTERQRLLDLGYTQTELEKELIGKAIANEIRNLDKASEEFKSLWQRFVEAIKKFLGIYKEKKEELEQSPISVAAERILNSDVSDLMSMWTLKSIYRDYYGGEVVTKIDSPKLETTEDVEFIDSKWVERRVRRKPISKFMPKTLKNLEKEYKKYIKGFLSDSNVDLPVKPLTEAEKESLAEINKYQTLIPELDSYQKLRDKYTKNGIALNSPIKVDGAKKADLLFYEDVRKMILSEVDDSVKVITVDDFIRECQILLDATYKLGFAEEINYLTYRINSTFQIGAAKPKPLPDFIRRFEEIPQEEAEEYINTLTPEQRYQAARHYGLTEDSDSGEIKHRKISLRFNDTYIDRKSHFPLSPAAWGNLTPFSSGNTPYLDSVLLHEIQNDFIETLIELKENEESSPESKEFAFSNSKKVLEKHILNQVIKKLGLHSIFNRLDIGGYTPPLLAADLKQTDSVFYQEDTPAYGDEYENLNEEYERVFQRLIQENIELLASDLNINFHDTDFIFNGSQKEAEKIVKEYLDNLMKPLNNTIRILYNLRQDAKARTLRYGIFGGFDGKVSSARINYINKEQANNYTKVGDFKYVIDALNDYEQRAPEDLETEAANPFISTIQTEYVNTRRKISDKRQAFLNMLPDLNYDIFNGLQVRWEKVRLNFAGALLHHYRKGNHQVDVRSLWANIIKQEASSRIKEYETSRFQKYKKLGQINSLLRYARLSVDEYGILVLKILESAQNVESQINPRILKLDKEIKSNLLDFFLENTKKIDGELERQLNYFTPLAHHLIQTSIKDYGKDTPIYFSGYYITMLTQGNSGTASIYTGPEEVEFPNPEYPDFHSLKIGAIRSFDNLYSKVGDYYSEETGKPLTNKIPKDIKKELNTRMSRMNYNKPYAVGPLYVAMSKIKGIKLKYVENIPGFRDPVGGYLVDVSNYEYNTPILFSRNQVRSAQSHKEALHKIYGANAKGFFNNISDTDLSRLREAVEARNGQMVNEYLEVRIAEVKEGRNAYLVIRKKNDKVYNEAMDALNESYQEKYDQPFETSFSEDEALSQQMLEEQERESRIPQGEDEDSTTMQRKIDILTKYFDVDVELDSDMEVAGMAISREGKKPLIKLNPRLLKSDTVIHEFGHIFIDLVGGLDNARIQAAIKQLKGSELWERVAEAYPELEGDALAKEVLATAIGMEGAELFKNDSYKRNWWERFLDWLYGALQGRFNVKPNHAKRLAREMLKGSMALNFGSFEGTWESKGVKYADFDKSVAQPKEILAATIRNLQTKINRWEKLAADDPTAKYLNKVETLKTALEEYLEVDNISGIRTTIDYLSTEFEKISNLLETKSYSPKQLNTIEAFVAAYDTIIPIQQWAKTKPLDLMNALMAEIAGVEGKEVTQEQADAAYNQLMTAINSLVGAKQSVTEAVKAMGTEYLAEIFANNSDLTENIWRVKLRRAFTDENIDAYRARGGKGWREEFEQALQRYVDQEIGKNYEAIREESLKTWRGLLAISPDINSFEKRLFDSGEVNSRLIQVVQKFFDRADMMKAKSFILRRNEMAELFEEFTEMHGTALDQKERYASILDIVGDEAFLVSEYKAEFYIKRRELRNAVGEARLLGEESTEYIDAVTAKNEWERDNIKPVTDEHGRTVRKPIAEWKNPKYTNMSPKTKKILDKLKDFIEQDDKLIYKNVRLKIEDPKLKLTFYKLPAIGKSDAQRFFENNFGSAIKASLRDRLTIRPDDRDFGQLDESGEVYTSEKGVLNYTVPIHYRGKLDAEEQSYDVFTMLLMNHEMTENYRQKTHIAADMEMLLSVIEDKEYVVQRKGQLLLQKHGEGKYALKPKGAGNELAMLRSIIEHRLYGIDEIPKFFGPYSVNKMANIVNSWAASSMLMINHFSAVTNVLQGKIMNFIEGMGGEHFTRGNLRNAEAMYWKDFKNFSSDMGSINPKAKTSLLLDYFEVMDELSSVSNKFIDQNRVRAMMKRSTLFGLSHIGEHYMHSTLMYSVLDNIKVMDKQKVYINKEGQQVGSREQAASLADVVKIENGKITFDAARCETGDLSNKKLRETTLLKVRSRIKKISADLHGQYDERMKASIQREWYGKSAFMLRKWMVRGFNRRWRGASDIFTGKQFADFENRDENDIYYSEETGSFEEGTYVSAIRFLINIIKDLKQQQSTMIQKWDRLTPHERANIRKSLTEAAMMTMAYLSYLALEGLAEGADDDNDYLAYSGAYYMRRLFGELTFYLNPLEAFRILKSPAASVSFSQQIIEALWATVPSYEDGQIFYPQYERQSGIWEKGDYKIWKQWNDVIPVWHQLNKDPKESLEFFTSNSF